MKRALLIGSIVAFFATAVFFIAADRDATRRLYDVYSAANTSEHGTSLAYAYLKKQGRAVSLLHRPIALGVVAREGVVFRLGGSSNGANSPFLQPDEDEWVRTGGRLVLGIASQDTSIVRDLEEPAGRKVFPFAPGVETIGLPQPRALDAAAMGTQRHALYTARGEVVVARESVGAGDVILLAVPDVFTNQHLASGNHLPLLLALAGTSRSVYFDETIHGLGAGDSALALLKDWNLGPFLLLVLTLTALILWRGSSRIGPAQEEWTDTRSEAVDLVDSLGALYQRSMNDGEALVLYLEALTRTVAAQTGLRGDALHQRVAALTHNLPPPRAGTIKQSELARGIQMINDAFQSLHKGTSSRRRSQ